MPVADSKVWGAMCKNQEKPLGLKVTPGDRLARTWRHQSYDNMELNSADAWMSREWDSLLEPPEGNAAW